MILIIRGDNTSLRLARMSEAVGEGSEALTYRNAMLQEKAADLIDHSRSLADQARSHPVQCSRSS
jgi:hypothetical protein